MLRASRLLRWVCCVMTGVMLFEFILVYYGHFPASDTFVSNIMLILGVAGGCTLSALAVEITTALYFREPQIHSAVVVAAPVQPQVDASIVAFVAVVGPDGTITDVGMKVEND